MPIVATRTTAKKSTSVKKPAAEAPARPATAKSATKARREVPAEQRRHYVEVAAYYIAERHGFAPGNELADWAAAEAEIDRLLAEGRLNP